MLFSQVSPISKSALIALYGVMVLLNLAILGTNAVRTYRVVKAETIATNESFVRAYEKYTTRVFDQIDGALRSLRIHLPEQLHAPGQQINLSLSRTLARVAAELPELETLGVADRSGFVVANFRYLDKESPGPVSIADREYFKPHVDQKEDLISVSNPVITRLTGKPAVGVGRRIVSPKGEFMGVVYATVSLEKLSRFFEDLKLGPGSSVSLFNPERYLLMRFPYNPKQVGSKFPPSASLKALMDQKAETGTYIDVSPVDKVERMFSFRTFEKYRFMVFIGQSTEQIFKGWRSNLYFSVVSSALILIVLGGALYLLGFALSAREADQAVVINAAKMSSLGEMSAGVAHEINNPLLIIQALSEQISREPQAGSDPAEVLGGHRGRAEKIRAHVERIARIVRGLKDFSRSGDRDPLTEVELSRIFEAVMNLCAERFKTTGVELRLELPERERVRAREVQIEQVLVNLLNNSYDAVRPLPEKWVRLSARVEADTIEISVTDSGPGIRPEIREKIMQPFFTTKEIGKGTGLGLSLSQGIIEEHGGRLFYDASEKNTCFRFTLSRVG